MEKDLKDLAAGVQEMRSVAKRLMRWAEDLEKSLMPGQTARDEPVQQAVPVEVVPAEVALAETVPIEAAPAEDVPVKAPLTFAAVKKLLGDLSAEGYGPQIKALIESFGAMKLSDLPESCYAELMEAAGLLGKEDGHAG